MSTTIPDFTECYIGWDEMEPTHIIFDCRYVKRATAIKRVADDFGIDFKDARCVVTYCRWRTRQERWEYDGGERWLDEQPNEIEDYPPEPPEGWEPDPEFGAFEADCSPDAPGATKCWKVATGL